MFIYILSIIYFCALLYYWLKLEKIDKEKLKEFERNNNEKRY